MVFSSTYAVFEELPMLHMAVALLCNQNNDDSEPVHHSISLFLDLQHIIKDTHQDSHSGHEVAEEGRVQNNRVSVVQEHMLNSRDALL
jgi:hypothetical protein